MIKGQEFQQLAETWIRGNREAEWRSAVSRSYYAAFHTARELLKYLGFQVPRSEQAHAYLWLRLSNCGDTALQLAGSDLNTLRRERNLADYALDRTFAQVHARLQVEAAKRIIHVLSAATSEPVRTDIINAIRFYERNVLREETYAC